MDPKYLGALLGYAHLKGRAGDLSGAMELYRQAAQAHPDEPSVYNNLALFHAQHRRLKEAIAAMGRAIQLDPKSAKYRNNVATILVDAGQVREAFRHLRAVHNEATAYYNLGYLLEKKGRSGDAAKHYAVALRKDPALVHARNAMQRLQSASKYVRAEEGTRGSRSEATAPPVRSFSPPPDNRPQTVRRLSPAPKSPRYDFEHTARRRQDPRPYQTYRKPHPLTGRSAAPISPGSDRQGSDYRNSLPDREPPGPHRLPPAKRLPPIQAEQSTQQSAPLPRATYHRQPVGSAPLPPPTSNRPASISRPYPR